MSAASPKLIMDAAIALLIAMAANDDVQLRVVLLVCNHVKIAIPNFGICIEPAPTALSIQSAYITLAGGTKFLYSRFWVGNGNLT